MDELLALLERLADLMEQSNAGDSAGRRFCMLKLKRYMKPYLGLLAAAILLLFGQAMLELTLPNYMSDIVNVGLQQGGITQSAPRRSTRRAWP